MQSKAQILPGNPRALFTEPGNILVTTAQLLWEQSYQKDWFFRKRTNFFANSKETCFLCFFGLGQKNKDENTASKKT